MEFLRATEEDLNDIVSIYDQVRGRGFCVWSDSYPTAADARRDYEADCLFVLKCEGQIIGCASVEPVAEDDDLPFWKINDGTHREISRVAIASQHQGKGYAKILVKALLEELRREGIRSVHLLAAKANPPAYRTYRSLGFEFLGECYRYGADFYCCELLL